MAGKNRRPSRDDGCCSVSFLKYVLFIFNFVFYLSGLCILAAGIWTLIAKSHYASLLATNTYLATTYVLIGAGIAVFLVGIVGCCGVLKENRCALLSFCFLLLAVFLLEAVTGILAYIYSEQIEKELKQSLNVTFAEEYGYDKSITTATERLHREFGCCGAFNYQDWNRSRWYLGKKASATSLSDLPGTPPRETPLVPSFCCKSVTSESCGLRDHPSNINTEGCVDALRDEIHDHEVVLGAIGLGISTVQLFGMVLSCCLYVKLKDFDDYKQEVSQHSYY